MLSSPLCSSDLVALLTVPYNHSPYSLLLLEQTIGNPDKHFPVHGAWSSRYQQWAPNFTIQGLGHSARTQSFALFKRMMTKVQSLGEEAGVGAVAEVARNQEERKSHNMDGFFGGTTPLSQHVTPPPPPHPGTPANEQHADPSASVQRVIITRIIRTPASHFGRPRACVPDIWQFVVKGSITKGIKTICKLCYPPVEYLPSTSTGSLHMQIEACHAYEYLEACHENDWPIKLKSLALPKSHFKVALVNWIVADDQSINVVECPEFRDLLLLLQESMLSCDIPHRTAIWSLIGKAWEHNFTELKKELAQSVGKISLTMDLWDDKSMRSCEGPLFITDRVHITDKTLIVLIKDNMLPTSPARHCDSNATRMHKYQGFGKPYCQTPTQALQRDPVAITHNITNKIRSSQLHCEEFKEIVTTGNHRERWLDAQRVSHYAIDEYENAKDGNAQETDGEPGKDSTDLELEEFAFKGCDEWGEES
ncbi:hypothetical protein JB92DRAFT_2833181 [Gautieria morchelliformis]|nr:hypothetical protein JB92DRAFT_2833181 [Gautieria morchelliformis]